jgi:16S rRNA G966 N2-methylase RsmD
MSTRLDGLTSASFTKFVKENENEEITKLLLGKKPDGVDLKEAADQILSRRKAKDKLPHWVAQDGLVFPPPLSIEQSSSEAAANYKKNILKGHHLVDLTGGMGVDLLTLSDQFEFATHVEIDPWLSEVFAHNSKLLSSNPITAVNTSAEDFLSSFSGKATFFIDPARRDGDKKKVFLFEDCSPNVVAMLRDFREKAYRVLVKAAPMIDITLGIHQLEFVSEVHVVSIDNECKEVLFLLNFETQTQPTIHCINIVRGETQHFSFTQEAEKSVDVSFSSFQKYLYEPNASIRKAGAFKSIAASFFLNKIANNTHLYTSDNLIENFPGRTFEVLSPFDKKNQKLQFPDKKANVISKNHPLSAEQIKSKFGLKDGGDLYLIAFRDVKDVSVMIVAKRV